NFLAATNNIVTLSNNYGGASEIYNGFDVTVNALLPRGIVLAGGPSIGRTESNYCFTIDSPQGTGLPPSQGGTSLAGLLYCDVRPELAASDEHSAGPAGEVWWPMGLLKSVVSAFRRTLTVVFVTAVALGAEEKAPKYSAAEWAAPGGDWGATRYSTLDQINTS